MVRATKAPRWFHGQYSIRVQVNEDLGTTPTINITTSDGAVLTSEDQPLSMLNNNINNPDVGPLYTYDFSILSTPMPVI